MRKRNPLVLSNNPQKAKEVVENYSDVSAMSMPRDSVNELIRIYYPTIPMRTSQGVYQVSIENLSENQARSIATRLQDNAYQIIEGMTFEEKQRIQHGGELEEKVKQGQQSLFS